MMAVILIVMAGMRRVLLLLLLVNLVMAAKSSKSSESAKTAKQVATVHHTKSSHPASASKHRLRHLAVVSIHGRKRVFTAEELCENVKRIRASEVVTRTAAKTTRMRLALIVVRVTETRTESVHIKEG